MNYSKLVLQMKDQELIEKFGRLVGEEREISAHVIQHLAEIDRRKLYAKEGYSSLFNYCVEKYHYSESAAYRRIQAARICPRFPEILNLLKQGKLNLVTLSLIEPHLDETHGKALLDKVLDKSKRAVEDLLSELCLKKEKTQDIIRRLPIQKRSLGNSAQNFTTTGGSKSAQNFSSNDENNTGNSRPVGSEKQTLEKQGEGSQKEKMGSLEIPFSLSDLATNTNQENLTSPEKRRVKIEFVADEGVAHLIERAKEVLRHKYPQGKLEDLVREAFELLLDKKDPQRKIARHEKMDSDEISDKGPVSAQKIPKDIPTEDDSKNQTRYVPQELQRKIFKRDGGRCGYVSDQGRQCSERGGLEVDHIQPFALGGKSTINNLRLLCQTHNQLRSIKTFGVPASSFAGKNQPMT